MCVPRKKLRVFRVFVHFCCLGKPHAVHVAQGWNSVATPSGWYEVLRGPRLQSNGLTHPRAKVKGKARRSQWQFPEHHRSPRDKSKVAWFEAATQVTGAVQYEVSVGDGPQRLRRKNAQVGPPEASALVKRLITNQIENWDRTKHDRGRRSKATVSPCPPVRFHHGR